MTPIAAQVLPVEARLPGRSCSGGSYEGICWLVCAFQPGGLSMKIRFSAPTPQANVRKGDPGYAGPALQRESLRQPVRGTFAPFTRRALAMALFSLIVMG